MAKGFLGWLYPRTWLFGRPYTHIIRDAWKAEPTSFLFLFTALGMLVGRFIPTEAFWWVLGTLSIGIVLGHLFWPTTYGLGRKKPPGGSS